MITINIYMPDLTYLVSPTLEKVSRYYINELCGSSLKLPDVP